MPKIVHIPEIGTVKIFRRRGTRNLRLSITGNNEIRLTLPFYLPYKTGVDFILNKRDWIISKQRPSVVLIDGQLIGKYHRLQILSRSGTTQCRARIVGNVIKVVTPPNLAPENEEIQIAIRKAALKSLRDESDKLLPPRLQELATLHGYTYRSVKARRLKSRWGSCSQHRDIVLNIFLMTLPWQLIDYVLIHELVHTRVLNHGPDFWDEMIKVLPRAKQLRSQLKAHAPYF